MNKRKCIKILTISSTILASLSLSAAIITKAIVNPSFYSIDRPFTNSTQHGAFYVQGRGVSLQVKTTGDATYVNANWLGSWRAELYKTSTSNGITTWNGSWNPSPGDYIRGVFDPSVGWPNYRKDGSLLFRTGCSGYSTDITRTGYVTKRHINDYQAVTSNDSFWYSNECDNYFYGPATDHPSETGSIYNTYNCLAYSVGVYDHWVWPWTYSPLVSQVDDYMLCRNGYENRVGTKYYMQSTTPMSGTQAIYYGGDHFAKVYAWDSQGMPTEIISKWGGWELIRSGKINPFTPYSQVITFSDGIQGKGYGAPIKYYK